MVTRVTAGRMNITRKWLRYHDACWENEDIDAFIPERGMRLTSFLSRTSKDIPATAVASKNEIAWFRDQLWVLQRTNVIPPHRVWMMVASLLEEYLRACKREPSKSEKMVIGSIVKMCALNETVSVRQLHRDGMDMPFRDTVFYLRCVSAYNTRITNTIGDPAYKALMNCVYGLRLHDDVRGGVIGRVRTELINAVKAYGRKTA